MRDDGSRSARTDGRLPLFLAGLMPSDGLPFDRVCEQVSQKVSPDGALKNARFSRVRRNGGVFGTTNRRVMEGNGGRLLFANADQSTLILPSLARLTLPLVPVRHTNLRSFCGK